MYAVSIRLCPSVDLPPFTPLLLCFLLSLNADKRREELLLVSRQNQAIYQRITSRQSEYRRQLWLDDWERAERRRDDISRYSRGLADKQVSVYICDDIMISFQL